MMWWSDGGTGWFAWVAMSFAMIAFWALVVWAVVALFRGTTNQTESRPDAVELLKKRFASGEIDAEEFEERRQVLGRRR